MKLDQLFNSAKTQDAGFEEGHISHRKDGDYIKQGGSWKPYTGGQKKDGAGKAAGTDEQTMRQSLINFMTKGAPHVPEADAKKAVEGLPGDTLNEMFENLKQQHGDKYLAKNEDTLKASIIEGMTPEQKQAVMEGKTYRRVKEGEGVVDITKADLEAAPEKGKDDAYMDEQGLHDIYMDIKNNELEDYTVEEIAKEYRITKGDAEVIKNRIENNKRAKEQDKQDRKDQAGAGSTGATKNKVEKKTVGDGKPFYAIEGTSFYFDTPEEAENAVLAESRYGKTYARGSKDEAINELQKQLKFKLDTGYGGKHSMDDFIKKVGPDEYEAQMWSGGRDTSGTLLTPFEEAGDERNLSIKKVNGKWEITHTERNGGEKSKIKPLGDAAPLTGDTKIRVRK